MYTEKVYLVAGGDGRYVHLADLLTQRGTVYAVGFDNPSDFSPEVRYRAAPGEVERRPDYLVLPMPVTKNGVTVFTPLNRENLLLSQVLDLCGRETLVLGGKLDEKTVLACEKRGLALADYLEREEFAVLNAIPTAEGAVQIAMKELPVTLSGQRVLITGYGRVAKLCHRAFAALGSQVTVAARSCKDLAWAQAYGAHTVPLSFLNRVLPKFQVVVNTVPARVFGEEQLMLLDAGTLIIDLASAPGGVDYSAAAGLGIKAIPALSLPGKVAPVTAAEAIAGTLDNIIAERGSAYV